MNESKKIECMKIKLTIIFLAFFAILWEGKCQVMVKKNFELAESQYWNMLNKAMDINCFPRYGICMSIQRIIVGKMKQ